MYIAYITFTTFFKAYMTTHIYLRVNLSSRTDTRTCIYTHYMNTGKQLVTQLFGYTFHKDEVLHVCSV